MSKRESKRRLKRRSKAYRRKIIIFNLFFICFIIVFLIYGSLHVFTHKKEYRGNGVMHYENGEYEEAIIEFDRALACNQWFSDDLDVEILLYKAECYLKMERFLEANAVYTEIRDNYETKYYDVYDVNFMIRLTSALNSYMKGDYVSSVAAMVSGVENGYTELALYVANCYEYQNRYDEMKEYYDLYSKTFGMDSFLYLKNAQYYIEKEDYSNAVAFIEQGITYGDSEYMQELLYTQIMCYERLGQYNTAFLLAQSYVLTYPLDEAGADIYEYLYTRIYIDETPVHDIYSNRKTEEQ